MALHQDGPDNPMPEPRRRRSGNADEVRFDFRPTKEEKPKKAKRDAGFAQDPSDPHEQMAREFGARAMRADGRPATPVRTPPKKAAKPPKQRKRRRQLWIPAVFLVVLMAMIGVLAYGYLTDPARSEVFFSGVHVGGVDLGGMSRDQATSALQVAATKELSNWQVDLRYSDLPDQSIRAEDIGMKLDLDQQLDAAWKVGREGGYLARRRAVEALKQQPFHASGGVTYDDSLLAIRLEQLREAIDREPVDASASFTPQNEQPFQYVDESPGKRLDVASLKTEIVQAIQSLQSTALDVIPEDIPPKVTRAALEQNLTCIVVVDTDIASSSTEGRNQNIRIALGKLDGMMLAPSTSLSFNKAIGKRADPANGYQQAPEIAYGELEQGIGGGVCQVSTTLYQAALRSGLEIIERSPHAIPSNYAEKGQDATVSDRGLDLVIRNNTTLPVYLRARMIESDSKSKRMRCEIAIYGRPLPDGTRYALETVQIGKDLQPEPEKEYVYDREGKYVTYVDEQEETLAKRLGYHVETYLVKMRADGMEVSRDKLSEDTYKPRPARVMVGVTARQPEPQATDAPIP